MKLLDDQMRKALIASLPATAGIDPNSLNGAIKLLKSLPSMFPAPEIVYRPEDTPILEWATDKHVCVMHGYAEEGRVQLECLFNGVEQVWAQASIDEAGVVFEPHLRWVYEGLWDESENQT